MKSKFLGLIALGLLAGPMAANANLVWSYSYSAPGDSSVFGSGVITTDNGNGTSFSILGMTGTASEDDGLAAILNLEPTPQYPASTYSCGFGTCWYLFFNNSLFAGSPTPSLDVGGVTFTNGIDVINLYNSGGQYLDLTQLNNEAHCNGHPTCGYSGTPIEFSIAAPEPATLALLGLGLAGIGFARRRKVA